MRIISADLTNSSKVPSSTTNATNVSDFNPGFHVACIYDRDWYIGITLERSVEFDEIYVKFLKRKETERLNRDDKQWIPVFKCLGLVTSLNVQGQRAQT